MHKLSTLREAFSGYGVDALILFHGTNIQYCTGFSGSNALFLLTKRSSILFTDPRYELQAAEEAPNCTIRIARGESLLHCLKGSRKGQGLVRIGFEEETILKSQWNTLEQIFPRAELVPLPKLLRDQRQRKTSVEVAAIREAASITDRVFEEILGCLQPGVTEKEIAAEISYRQRRHGGEGDAFDPMVLFGSRSAYIHGTRGDAVLKNGDPVLLDFGCIVRGYRSDLSRTVACGKASRLLCRLHSLVREAQDRAVEALAVGRPARLIDAAARNVFVREGLEEYFPHALGHGIGLDIHEAPVLSAVNRDPLCEGAVFTIEPGLYLPGKFGVRVEDDFILTKQGPEMLSRAPRDLITV